MIEKKTKVKRLRSAPTTWLGSVIKTEGSKLFYESCEFEGTIYKVTDAVALYSETNKNPLGKIVALYESGRKKMMRINWFYRKEEIIDLLDNNTFPKNNTRNTLNYVNKSAKQKELFLSTHCDDNYPSTLVHKITATFINDIDDLKKHTNKEHHYFYSRHINHSTGELKKVENVQNTDEFIMPISKENTHINISKKKRKRESLNTKKSPIKRRKISNNNEVYKIDKLDPPLESQSRNFDPCPVEIPVEKKVIQAVNSTNESVLLNHNNGDLEPSAPLNVDKLWHHTHIQLRDNLLNDNPNHNRQLQLAITQHYTKMFELMKQTIETLSVKTMQHQIQMDNSLNGIREELKQLSEQKPQSEEQKPKKTKKKKEEIKKRKKTKKQSKTNDSIKKDIDIIDLEIEDIQYGNDIHTHSDESPNSSVEILEDFSPNDMVNEPKEDIEKQDLDFVAVTSPPSIAVMSPPSIDLGLM